MFGLIPDPRRFEACAYLPKLESDKLKTIIALDNELWAIPSRSKEALLARIRLQFWLDEIENIHSKTGHKTPISSMIAENFANDKETLAALKILISAHIDDLEFFPKRTKETNIWAKYFECVFIAFAIDDIKIINICAQIIASANLGDFSKYKLFARQINNFIKSNKQKKVFLIPALSIIKLARNPKLFENIIKDENHIHLGIRAKIAIFGAILFGRI